MKLSFIPSNVAAYAKGLAVSFSTLIQNGPPKVAITPIEIKPAVIHPPSSRIRLAPIVAVCCVTMAIAYLIFTYILPRLWTRKPPPSLPPPPARTEHEQRTLPETSSLPFPPPEQKALPPPVSVLSSTSLVDLPPERIEHQQTDSPPPVSVTSTSSLGDLPPLVQEESDPEAPYSRSPSPEPIESDNSSSERSISPASHSPSPPPVKRPSMLAVARRTFFSNRHFSKWMKYRLVLTMFARILKLGERVCGNTESPSDKIAKAWNTLRTAVIEPTKFKTADEQYSTTIDALREVIGLLLSADEGIKADFAQELKCCMEISYLRFAGIEFFDYCKGLVQMGTGMELPDQLRLDNFFEELKTRAKLMDHPSEGLNMNPIAREWKKFKGSANIWFDPLIGDNVPYLDGMLMIIQQGRQQMIRLLRHGVPFYHHNPTEVVSNIPWIGPAIAWCVPQPASVKPRVNPDYVAFILQAKAKDESILQVILENGQTKGFGNERDRVIARLELADEHENFYALALSLDGKFFEHFNPNEPLSHLKTRLQALLIPDKQKERSAGEILEETGYCIPEKVLQKSQLADHVGQILDEVQALYFSEEEKVCSIGDHQAFILLSYVHITLFLARRLNINILEAFCKDDIDRGNVMKTLLKLCFLYLSRNVTTDNLNAILVNTLAAPFIVKKQAIIKSRLVLIERVVPRIAAAFQRNSAPQSFIFGGAFKGDYYTFGGIEQGIYPQGPAAQNLEEYQAFLDAREITLPPFEGNFIAQFQVEKPREGFSIKINDKASLCSIESLQSLGLSADDALKAAAYMGADLHDFFLRTLQKLFDNPSLHFFIQKDLESTENRITASLENGTMSINRTIVFKLVGKNGIKAPFSHLKVVVEMPDLTTGEVQCELEVIK